MPYESSPENDRKLHDILSRYLERLEKNVRDWHEETYREAAEWLETALKELGIEPPTRSGYAFPKRSLKPIPPIATLQEVLGEED